MPIVTGRDSSGKYYYRWGNTGKQYYYDPNSESSRIAALRKAKKQQTAIYASGYRGDGKYVDFKRANYTFNHLKKSTNAQLKDAIESFECMLQISLKAFEGEDSEKAKEILESYRTKISKLKLELQRRKTVKGWNCHQYIESEDLPCPTCGREFDEE